MASSVRILSVPYDSGHRLKRMGCGPAHLIDNGLPDCIRNPGRDVTVTTIESALPLPTETSLAFEMHGLVADQVRGARSRGEFPLILSGNCNYAAIGAATGLGTEGTGVIWFDAHGESETPETSASAFLDGMGLAMLVGQCWTRRLADVPGFRPLDPRRAVLVGARDLSDGERDFFPRHQIGVVSIEDVRGDGGSALQRQLARLKEEGVERLYVHIDADVYDPDSVGHANLYSATAGAGLTAGELDDCLQTIAGELPIQAAAITAYDPAVDPDGRMRTALIALAARLAGSGSI